MTGDEQAVKVEHEYLFDKNTLQKKEQDMDNSMTVSYTHLRAHET